jgi:pimeloyl-ACP methyl ester carboxylesterase
VRRTATAPLIVTWHMLDAPRTDAAFAAALPMNELPAWRVHLGMPMCGARMVDGRLDAALELVRKDALLAFLAPIARQAVAEFPAALAALRDQLPVDEEPVSILGASLGGSVALQVLRSGEIPVRNVALVNPAVRIRPGVELLKAITGRPTSGRRRRTGWPTSWTSLLVPGEITARPPLLLVSESMIIPRCAPMPWPWSVRSASSTRGRTTSSWSPCPIWRTRWLRSPVWSRRHNRPRPGL